MAQCSPAESPYDESPDIQMEDMAHGLPDFNPEKSPRFGNLGFLKGLTERKTTRGSGLSTLHLTCFIRC